ncbi:unnamed protein product [Caenorhabditis brenneri]
MLSFKKTLLACLVIGVYACVATYSPMSYVDRPCGNDLGNLWLDIVAVVDNSHGMTDEGLGDIAATLTTVVSMGTRIGTNYTDPRSTRLALVTYNSQAKANADLNKFQNLDDVFNNVFNDLQDVAQTDISLLSYGLGKAEQLFADGQVGYDRNHYKRAVIVFASAYAGTGDVDPVHAADRLKTSGVKIITVAYNQRGDGSLLDQLSKVASPRYNFTNNSDGNLLVNDIQNALLETNCFCPTDWVQYRQSYYDITSPSFGSCLRPVGITANWRAAQMNCRNQKEKNTNLHTEFTQHKHDFVLAAVQNTTGFSMPYTYHIGLNLVTGTWVWDQPITFPQPALQNWTNWAPGYPIVSSSMTAVQNQQSGLQTFWKNVAAYTAPGNYFCETYSCDTDNYCVPTNE